MRHLKDIDREAKPYSRWCWGIAPDLESLDRDAHHCVETYLDDMDRDKWPAKLVIIGHERQTLTSDEVDAGLVVEEILERLDEEYANPNGDKTEASDAVRAKAEELAELIASEYEVYWCDEVERFEVDVMAWVSEHARHWLETP